MVAKTFILVLLGAAVVLANPAQRNRGAEIEVERTWTEATEIIESVWEKLEKKGEKKLLEELKGAKNQALIDIQIAKKLTREVIGEGKNQAIPQLNKILESLQKLGNSVKTEDKLVQKTVERLLELLSSNRAIITRVEIENDWNESTEIIKSVWEKLEKKSEKKLLESLREVKNKALANIEAGRKLIREALIEGKKSAVSELKEILASLRKLANSVKTEDELVKKTVERLLKILSINEERLAKV